MKNISDFLKMILASSLLFSGRVDAAIFSFGCENSAQQFFFNRTVYSSTVTLVLKGAAGGGISTCPGN